jgi:hypothetical protein
MSVGRALPSFYLVLSPYYARVAWKRIDVLRLFNKLNTINFCAQCITGSSNNRLTLIAEPGSLFIHVLSSAPFSYERNRSTHGHVRIIHAEHYPQ